MKIGLNEVYENIKEVIKRARNSAFLAVNFSMVQAYWNIGRIIVEEEQKGKNELTALRIKLDALYDY